MRLERETFLEIVRQTPLVSVDLIVRDENDKILIGLRNNEPARDYWFVPGGRICKDERIAQAFRRVAQEELGAELDISQGEFLGVYEHLYDTNAGEEPGFGTHYVVLGYSIRITLANLRLEQSQHREYRWCSPEEILADPAVHPNTKAYFA